MANKHADGFDPAVSYRQAVVSHGEAVDRGDDVAHLQPRLGAEVGGVELLNEHAWGGAHAEGAEGAERAEGAEGADGAVGQRVWHQ